MLGKKASRNGRILNSNRPFDFQSLTQSEPFSFFNSNVLNKHILKTIITKKKKKMYDKNNSNQTLQVSRF